MATKQELTKLLLDNYRGTGAIATDPEHPHCLLTQPPALLVYLSMAWASHPAPSSDPPSGSGSLRVETQHGINSDHLLRAS